MFTVVTSRHGTLTGLYTLELMMANNDANTQITDEEHKVPKIENHF